MLSQNIINKVYIIISFVEVNNSDLALKIVSNTSPDTDSAREQLFLSQSLLKYTNNKNNKKETNENR